MKAKSMRVFNCQWYRCHGWGGAVIREAGVEGLRMEVRGKMYSC